MEYRSIVALSRKFNTLEQTIIDRHREAEIILLEAIITQLKFQNTVKISKFFEMLMPVSN